MSQRPLLSITVPESVPAENGRPVVVRTIVTNATAESRSVLVRVVGALSGPLPAARLDVAALSEGVAEIEVFVPAGLPPGNHALLVEMVDPSSGAVLLAEETVIDVQHTRAVSMHISPSSIRRRRRGRIRIIVRNHDEETHRMRIVPEPDDDRTRVFLERPDFEIRPGEMVRVHGRLRLKAFWFGKQREKWYSIVGEGAGVPVYARGNVRQIPMIGKNVKSLMVLLTILMVWAASTLAIIRAISPATDEAAAGAEAPTNTEPGGGDDANGGADVPALTEITGVVTATAPNSDV
ncbi:MAG: hypothetical protein ACKOD2_05030, partial [Ilumatobacteraceae bacterium]